MNDSMSLSIIRPVNQRTREEIDGPFTEARIESINEWGRESISRREDVRRITIRNDAIQYKKYYNIRIYAELYRIIYCRII